MRDRLVWQLLSENFALPNPLRIIEVGGTKRLGDRLREKYEYVNADITGGHAPVDIPIHESRFPLPDTSRNVGVLSYVLSSIAKRSVRTQLLSELRRVVVEGGRLLILDDTDFSVFPHHTLGSGAYFHLLRLGRALLEELVETGWTYQVVTHCTFAAELDATREMPYVIAIARPGALANVRKPSPGGTARRRCPRSWVTNPSSTSS